MYKRENFLHQFECIDCERRLLVESVDMNTVDPVDDLSEVECPFCGGELVLDSKHEIKLVKSIDVRSYGYKTEDIGEINWDISSEYISLE